MGIYKETFNLHESSRLHFMKNEKKEKHFIQKPIYKGGDVALRKFIGEQMRYPKLAIENAVEGTVVVRYTIAHTGRITRAKVVSTVGYGCDEEALRLTKLLKFEVPSTRGTKVQFQRTIQIHFRLPKNTGISYTYHVSPSKVKGKSYTYTYNGNLT